MSYVRVGILGQMLGGEVWSINPVFDPSGEFPGSVDQAALESAAAAIAAIAPGLTLKELLSSSLSVTGARVEVRNDADDALIALAIATSSPAHAGSNAPRMPPQAAMVFSLRTNSPGASGRGRLFWPCPGNQINAQFHTNSGLTAGLLTEMATYLHAIESALATAFPLIGFDLAVRSKATASTPHVVRLQCGDVIDTQRRRRDALPEAYATLAF